LDPDLSLALLLLGSPFSLAGFWFSRSVDDPRSLLAPSRPAYGDGFLLLDFRENALNRPRERRLLLLAPLPFWPSSLSLSSFSLDCALLVVLGVLRWKDESVRLSIVWYGLEH
jgi:hypothetical protein